MSKLTHFDAFPVFDPRPIAVLAEKLYTGNGAALTNLWRTRQFEYTWLRTISSRYADFMRVTEDALVFATRALKHTYAVTSGCRNQRQGRVSSISERMVSG